MGGKRGIWGVIGVRFDVCVCSFGGGFRCVVADMLSIGSDFSRIVNDGPLRVRATSGQCWPWLSESFYRSWIDPTPHSRRAAIDTASPSAFEIAPFSPDERGPTTYPWNNTSTLTRGVRAVTTFFIQQLDDHQLLPSFTSRSLPPVETAPLRSLSLASFFAPTPHSSPDAPQRKLYNNNHTSLTDESDRDAKRRFCGRFSNSWQRVCHATNAFYEQLKALPTSYGVDDSKSLGSHSKAIYSPSSTSSDTSTINQSETPSKTPIPNRSSSSQSSLEFIFGANSPIKTLSPDAPAVASSDSEDAGIGRDPKQARGSCMAIVIGLVVGVMWF